jgi:hypothetical protein
MSCVAIVILYVQTEGSGPVATFAFEGVVPGKYRGIEEASNIVLFLDASSQKWLQ